MNMLQIVGGLALALFTTLACGKDNNTGKEKGPCYGNGTCNDGLTCLSETCVKSNGPSLKAERQIVNVDQRSKRNTSKMLVSKIANEAYAQWTMATGENCPSSLSDLSKYTNERDFKDSWGSDLIMLCGENVPLGATTGFAVLSKGPDGTQGTEDDIKSWE